MKIVGLIIAAVLLYFFFGVASHGAFFGPIQGMMRLPLAVLPVLAGVLLLVLGIKLIVTLFTACSRQIDKVSAPHCEAPQPPVWNAGSAQERSAESNVSEAELMQNLSRTAEKLSQRLESLEIILNDGKTEKEN